MEESRVHVHPITKASPTKISDLISGQAFKRPAGDSDTIIKEIKKMKTARRSFGIHPVARFGQNTVHRWHS